MSNSTNGVGRVAEATAVGVIEVFSTDDLPQGDPRPLTTEMYDIRDVILDTAVLNLESDAGFNVQCTNRTQNPWVFLNSAPVTWLNTQVSQGSGNIDINDAQFILTTVDPGEGFTGEGILFGVEGTHPDLTPFIATPLSIHNSLISAKSWGVADNFTLVTIDHVIWNGKATGGFKISNCQDIRIGVMDISSDGTGTETTFQISGITEICKIEDVTFRTSTDEAAIRIDPSIPDDASVIVQGCTTVKIAGAADQVPLFDTSGSTGSFTSAAQAEITATAITSVSQGTQIGSGFIARFNHAGTDVFVGQEVVISAFVTRTEYNVTGIVSVTGAGFFEIRSILDAGDDTGSFLSNSTTIGTSSTTGLVEGDGLVLGTISSVAYDGGTVLYNLIADTSFQINRTFTESEFGTWSSEGLDHTDPRVLASNNPGYASSTATSSLILFQNDTAATIPATVTDYQDLDFTGVFLVLGANNQRWKLSDSVTGEMTYTGKEPRDCTIQGYLSFDSAANTIYTMRAILNGVDAPLEFIEPSIDLSVPGQIILQIPCSVVEGDALRLQIKKADAGGTNDYTITDMVIEFTGN